MQTDKTTKLLLAAIAIGLFLNAFVPLLQPPVVEAQSTRTMERYLRSIDSELRTINGTVGLIFAKVPPLSSQKG
mgnify:CR=1 FL=1